MDKFTRGPWEAIGNLVRSAMSDGGFLIAECRDGNGQPHSDEANTNARLIAAAPELFAGLLWAMQYVPYPHAVGSQDYAEGFTPKREAALRAIAKATGEQA